MYHLLDREKNRAFYESRYKGGYMDSWDAGTIRRVEEFLEACELPEVGSFLDYGCGTGVFTNTLQDAFPQACCVGADIAENALTSAREKYPGIEFCCINSLQDRAFDVVFSHHVLEHVADLPATLEEVANLVRPTGHMVHILPCGNRGSLEERLCADLKDGRDPLLGNRFVFEDAGHVRRLTSDELARAFRQYGFSLEHAWYRNHFWGGVDWITASNMFATFPDPANAKSVSARIRLTAYRAFLTGIGRLRAVATAKAANGGVVNSLARAVHKGVAVRSAREWRTRRGDPDGSAMYLHFVRRP